MDVTATVAVLDRVVTVHEYGDPDGQPVFVLHGTPACGAGFDWADEPARANGVRLLAPDRPGVGRSSPLPPGRPPTVRDYPAQLAELADALAIDRFAVGGYSGGGPYAVAAAALLPDRVTKVAVASGMGQMGVWATADDFEKTDRQLLRLSLRRPRLAKLVLSTSARLARLSPKSAMKSFAKELSPSDRAVLADAGPPAEVMKLFTEAFVNGAGGVVADYVALAGEWGLDLDSVQVPVHVWHGDADTMVPLRHGEELARRIPGATLTVWPGEGHLGPITHAHEILADLVA
jgi:pimeloyl-ACP methyl ester carboxylesterase